MPDIYNPTQLVDEFKKSGEFDRLRRELLTEFRSAEGFASFMSRVEDITRHKLSSDGKILLMPETSAHRELLQELNRYPLVGRTVAETPKLNDPALAATIRERVNKIIRENRGERDMVTNGSAIASRETAQAPLSIQTQSDGQTSAVGVNGIDSQDQAAEDGYGSEDSAMLESPLSDKDPSVA